MAQTVLAHGTGALNIDGCRIEGQPRATGTVNPHAPSGVHGVYGSDPRTDRQQRYDANLPAGRWPANVVLDEAAAALLDQQSGERKSPGNYQRSVGVGNAIYGKGMGNRESGDMQIGYGDSGGPSRFFYVAKASRRERNAGLAGMPERFTATMNNGIGAREHDPNDPRAHTTNHHPTVKPIALMRWLVRLVTPPGGLVLDPFMGSGSTGCACALEGFDFLGIEQDPDYAAIAERRIAYWQAKRPVAIQPELDLAGAAD